MLFVTSCVNPSGKCERTAFWDDKFDPKLEYAIVLNDAFEYDENDQPTKQILLGHRINYLEKYCYQTRIQ